MTAASTRRRKLQSLEEHLRTENPVLTDVVANFRQLDRVSRQLGLFDREESHTGRIPWWPLISVLGIYSSGKSAFINHYLGYPLQATGNQALDDKFTVICFTGEKRVRSLPGVALDADPRFPLYKISQAIEEVARGQSDHIDRYLQLRTCPSEKLRGRILIDSPGFDADEQRSSTLRITDRIIDISDLVLVFFDARHPESGSMQDTLKHLVGATINRRDANKFLYILNQIDSTARENNTEEVFAAWKRALAQQGLTTGCCFAVYNPEMALDIADDKTRARLENRRDTDLRAIYDRIDQVGVERAYRIIGLLKKTVQSIEQESVPLLQEFVDRWRRTVLKLDALVFGGVLALFLITTIWAGYWEGVRLKLPFSSALTNHGGLRFFLILLLIAGIGYAHYRIRLRAAARVGRKLLAELSDPHARRNYARAFRKNSDWWRSILQRRPVGWSQPNRASLARVFENANDAIRNLNDTFTNPSGRAVAPYCAEPLEPPEAFDSQAADESGSEVKRLRLSLFRNN
ncbi:MAG: dynamin family protein [Desulfobacterales bacterium]